MQKRSVVFGHAKIFFLTGKMPIFVGATIIVDAIQPAHTRPQTEK